MTPKVKTALVTGASSGIGNAISRALAREGVQVWATSRTPESLEPHESIEPVALDLLNPASIDAAAQEALAASGGIDLLVNNAGSGWLGPAELADEAVLQEQFQVLFFGPMQLVRAILPTMRERGHGLIVNTASLASEFPLPYLGPYSAAKSALTRMTEQIQIEAPESGIYLLDLCPGDIRTGFNSAMKVPPPEQLGRHGASFQKAWECLERELNQAPPPDRVAEAVLQWIRRPASRKKRVGSFFQAVLAPGASRFFPRSWALTAIRMYYGM